MPLARNTIFVQPGRSRLVRAEDKRREAGVLKAIVVIGSGTNFVQRLDRAIHWQRRNVLFNDTVSFIQKQRLTQ